MLPGMTALRLTLLGAFALTAADGATIRIETRKARALLSVLIMARRRPLPRDHLAGLLWSRGETRQALASLSQAIYSLRRSLDGVAPDLIAAETDLVSVDTSRLSVDALEIEDAAAEGTTAGRRRCLALYGGGFLDDLAIDAEEGYSEWRSVERARLEGIVTRAGTALMLAWEAEPEKADVAIVDHMLSIDPYSEPAMRVRMRLLALDGRHAAAIGAAEGFARRLAEDLAFAPSAELADLADRIRAGELPAAPRRSHGATRHAAGKRPVLLSIAAVFVIAGAFLWATLARDRLPDPDRINLLVRPFDAGPGVQADLAQGFSDDLATELVRRSALAILSRESGRLIPEDADASSGASHVLRGRIRADENRWVLNLWITETGSRREVWAERFLGNPDDPRDLRDEIVTRISDRIGLALLPPPELAPVALPDPAVPAYLRALSRLHSGTPEANAEAIVTLTALVEAYPDAIDPIAALVVAHERVAFEADDYARAAGLHWLEGYLSMKRLLAETWADHPDLHAARARLALRRLDYATAELQARKALDRDASHVAALEILARTLAVTGATKAAEAAAVRAITLSPADPGDGYTALALAAFADGDMNAATEAAGTALEVARGPPLLLRVLTAAIRGLGPDAGVAHVAFADFVAAVESRPYGAGQLGEVVYVNPRAATWRRPSGAEAATFISFTDPAANARLRDGLVRADPSAAEVMPAEPAAPLSGEAIEDLLLDRRIEGWQTWLVQEDWSQLRTADGTVRQRGVFGPLPAARSGQSRIIDGRLCDQWVWQGTTIENCQLVVPTSEAGGYALIGETGRFPFRGAGEAGRR